MSSNTISKFITSLLPTFAKSRLLEDINVTLKDLTDNTIPPYATASEYFNRSKLKSKDATDFNTLFNRAVKLDRSYTAPNYVGSIYKVLLNSVESLNYINKHVDQYFSKDIATAGLTYQRANVLRYVEVAGFVNKYSRKLLLWTYAKENTAYGLNIENPFTKAEEEWLYKNREGFLAGIRVMAIKSSVLSGIVASIPNMIVVPEEQSVVEATVGVNAIDPLMMGLIPVKLNPIYHIGLLVAEWQVARYESGVEERRALEYRLLILEGANAGDSPDAKMEKEIIYTQERLKKLNYKLARMEEDL